MQPDDMLLLGSEQFTVVEGNELGSLIRVQSIGSVSDVSEEVAGYWDKAGQSWANPNRAIRRSMYSRHLFSSGKRDRVSNETLQGTGRW